MLMVLLFVLSTTALVISVVTAAGGMDASKTPDGETSEMVTLFFNTYV